MGSIPALWSAALTVAMTSVARMGAPFSSQKSGLEGFGWTSQRIASKPTTGSVKESPGSGANQTRVLLYMWSTLLCGRRMDLRPGDLRVRSAAVAGY